MKCLLFLLFTLSSILINSHSHHCDVPERFYSISIHMDPRLKNVQDSFVTVYQYFDLPYIWMESKNTARVLKNCVADLFNFSRSTIQLIWRNYKEDQLLNQNPRLHSLR
ncbi:hypothetical protein PENTCL1PPCAC_11716, partial [Pristionchus entomophagus]